MRRTVRGGDVPADMRLVIPDMVCSGSDPPDWAGHQDTSVVLQTFTEFFVTGVLMEQMHLRKRVVR